MSCIFSSSLSVSSLKVFQIPLVRRQVAPSPPFSHIHVTEGVPDSPGDEKGGRQLPSHTYTSVKVFQIQLEMRQVVDSSLPSLPTNTHHSKCSRLTWRGDRWQAAPSPPFPHLHITEGVPDLPREETGGRQLPPLPSHKYTPLKVFQTYLERRQVAGSSLPSLPTNTHHSKCSRLTWRGDRWQAAPSPTG